MLNLKYFLSEIFTIYVCTNQSYRQKLIAILKWIEKILIIHHRYDSGTLKNHQFFCSNYFSWDLFVELDTLGGATDTDNNKPLD